MTVEINSNFLKILFSSNEDWNALQFASGQGQLYLWDGMPEDLMVAGVLFGLEKCKGSSFYVFHQSIAKREALLSEFSNLPSSGKSLPILARNNTESLFSLGGGFLKLWTEMPREAMLTLVSFGLGKSNGMKFRIDPATDDDKIELLGAFNGTIQEPSKSMVKRNMPESNY